MASLRSVYICTFSFMQFGFLLLYLLLSVCLVCLSPSRLIPPMHLSPIIHTPTYSFLMSIPTSHEGHGWEIHVFVYMIIDDDMEQNC